MAIVSSTRAVALPPQPASRNASIAVNESGRMGSLTSSVVRLNRVAEERPPSSARLAYGKNPRHKRQMLRSIRGRLIIIPPCFRDSPSFKFSRLTMLKTTTQD
eukprot:Protomagalhaensia_wolfi_Nauph_80__2874@NODE_2970_length_929_cov_203_312360_g2328_i0_p1_GENE_NODE_2970_length_929_cov_203_312360_g2328_i0NODE_2970_length_929_cov_203_312360_g2328_i0_p1_ORF_typecomplete_len103_score3_14_NODE_2970_length_929_cov_203_312360_g2328_i0445753